MKTKLFHLTEPQKNKLKKVSESTGLSVAELIRRAIDLYLKQEHGE